MWNVHSRFLARTVWVRNGEVDLAYRALNRVLNNESVFKTARLWERYEKPFRKRGRLCYENVVLLAFLASIGLTLLILGCALAEYNWWPTFVIIFYVLSPIPIAIGRRCTSDSSYTMRDTSPCADLMWFITSVIVVSAFGLPAVMYRTSIIQVGSMAFIMSANLVIFITITIYFMTFGSDDSLPNF
ncbi:unnamed protein product [Rotaria magnacalcarata]|uniref:Leptin receptor overlapping transcript-like 1 n=2 Tax=Rotaria magnacalcarata TaxID=392030 RepID=A0A819E2A2_9BILA|nr:unnamed protein product [Rotaria magnacalcarata]CAF3894854.1 unnamed protein product [Rotaria magnacalcarata]CAF3914404.1 unnamed protein product [Rotaria magnacalcarata]